MALTYGTHSRVELFVPLVPLHRVVLVGIACVVLLAMIKGFAHATFPNWVHNGPISSTINNILLQLLGQVIAGWALLSSRSNSMGSFAVTPAFVDIISVIVSAFLFTCFLYIIAKEVYTAVRVRNEQT